ncbi:hypothetical protein AAY473_001557, partial [Plecturocebus cupreus]
MDKRSCYVAQASLELLSSRHPRASASQSVQITAVNDCTQAVAHACNPNTLECQGGQITLGQEFEISLTNMWSHSPRLESSGTIEAQGSLDLCSDDPSASASQVVVTIGAHLEVLGFSVPLTSAFQSAGTTGLSHNTRPSKFLNEMETEFCYIALAGLKFLSSSVYVRLSLSKKNGEENVGVGSEDDNQSPDHIHTSRSGKDAFLQVCVRTRELEKWGTFTEEVMDDIGATEWQAADIASVDHGVQQPCSKSPSCHFKADCPGHDQRVKQRVAKPQGFCLFEMEFRSVARLECSGLILAHCNFRLLDSSDSPVSTSQ